MTILLRVHMLSITMAIEGADIEYVSTFGIKPKLLAEIFDIP